jgi:hypothetical protein
VDLATELIKAYGPPGLIALVLWVMLFKSEQREKLKDTRIQMLENQLIESYDERIAAADRIGDAIHSSANAAINAAKAIDGLSHEVRNRHD